MGKTKRRRKVADASVEAFAPEGAPAAWFSGYQGAGFSSDRGQINWPALDARDELDQFTRAELQRRIHWLKANFGFVRGLIRNSADLVGWVTPQAETEDAKWEKEAEGIFRERTGLAEVFDVAGKFDFEEAQLMLMRTALTDGDVLTVMSKGEDGGARFAFYQTHQLASPKGAGKEWRDGIQIRKRRHVAYGLRDTENNTVTVVPASACIYFGEFDNPGEDRPVPPLAHAVNHSVDITETWGFIKKAIKVSSLLGAVREKDGQATPRARQGITGGPAVGISADGHRFEVSNVWDGGQIPELPPGEKLSILHDERPHPNYQDFTRMLIRDIAVGFGLQPEVVWELIRMTGPGIRFVMDVADRWVKCRQKRLKKWGAKVWQFTLACEIDAGRLGLPADGRWWKLDWTHSRNLTIDRGQMSRARLAEIDAGVGTWADWQEFDGRDWKDRVRQRVQEVAFAEAECAAQGVEFLTVFPPRPGAAAVPEAEEGKPKRNDTEEEDDA